MPRDGALLLSDYPGDTVHLACRKCPRWGQYPKLTLVTRYRDDITLPTLKDKIAKCPRQGLKSDDCGSYYVELVPDIRS